MAYSKDVLQKIADGYRADYEEYRATVLNGGRPASRSELMKVRRQDSDIANGVDGYVWDWNAAVRPLVWIAVNLRFPKGVKRGSRAFLAPWEVFDIMTLFGWISPTTGKRRYSQAYIEVARKNGKSVLMGFLIDYCAFGEVDGVDCFIAATSLDQAMETFTRAADSLTLAKHKNVKVANSKNNKVIEWKGSTIRAITGEPKDGKLAYCTIIDEYHQHKDNQLIDSILSGNVSDQQSLLLRITTAGTDLNGVCHAEYEKCQKILKGQVQNRRYFVSIYEADEGDDFDDERTWYKANPNLGDSVSIEDFRGIYENARPSESDMITFKTKNLNMWVRGMRHWANMPIWEEKCRWTVDPETLKGQPCYGGLDLSSVYDFTAFTLDFPTDRGHLQLSHFWVADNQVEAIARQCQIPLRQWIAAGYVTSTPGDVIDYRYVVDYIAEQYEAYSIQYIACDRWHLDRIEMIMPPWFADLEFEFSQGMKAMSQSLGNFERAYLTGRVSANANPVLDWMMACVDVQVDTAGNAKPVKPRRQQDSTRIDGVITSIMAHDCAETYETDTADSEIFGALSFWK